MQQSSKGICVASMVLGIASIVFSFAGGFLTWLGLAAAVVGLVLSIMGKKKARAAGEPTGMATAGLVTSIIALALWVVMLIVGMYLVSQLSSAVGDMVDMVDMLG